MSERASVRYSGFYAVVTILFLLGVGMVAASHFMQPPPMSPFPWSDVVRDLGMVVAPIAVVSAVYEVFVRKQFEQHMRDLASGFSHVGLVFAESRPRTLEEIIEGAKTSLIITGVTPLYEFVGREAWLADRFGRLKEVKILCLDPASQYVKTRDEQAAGESQLKAQITVHEILLAKLQEHIKGKPLEIEKYDLPPAEFFFIADSRVILATWYPYGRGESSPCIFVENAGRNDETRKLRDYFLGTFNDLSIRAKQRKPQ